MESKADPAAVQLLLAEHEQSYEMYRHSEELGERRVNFFLTLVTAVVAALLLADEPLVQRRRCEASSRTPCSPASCSSA